MVKPPPKKKPLFCTYELVIHTYNLLFRTHGQMTIPYVQISRSNALLVTNSSAQMTVPYVRIGNPFEWIISKHGIAICAYKLVIRTYGPGFYLVPCPQVNTLPYIFDARF